MATKVCLLIDDDGKMYVSTEDVAGPDPAAMADPPAPPAEDKGTPVANIDEALAAIKQMAEAGSMTPTAGDVALPAGPEGAAPAPGGNPEEEAMMQSFGGAAR